MFTCLRNLHETQAAFRMLPGTGSSGATISLYVEKYVSADAGEQALNQETAEALKSLVNVALTLSDMQKLTGRDKPTVIT